MGVVYEGAHRIIFGDPTSEQFDLDFLLGDVNLDGKVDASDATLTLQSYVRFMMTGDYGLTPEQMRAADVNGDGIVDAQDATAIMQMYIESITHPGMHKLAKKDSHLAWHLIPVSRLDVMPPEQKTETVDIPGADGTLDLSLTLTTYPTFKNRVGTWDFYVNNEKIKWETIKQEMMNYLNGRIVRFILIDDPEYYYEGKVYVGSVKSDSNWSQIQLNYDLYPYKRKRITSTENWVWDTFNFDTGIITDGLFKDILLSETAVKIQLTRELIGTMPVVPTFTITGADQGSVGATVSLVNPEVGINIRKTFYTGTVQDPDYIFTSISEYNDSYIEVSGTGTISIDFRGGML